MKNCTKISLVLPILIAMSLISLPLEGAQIFRHARLWKWFRSAYTAKHTASEKKQSPPQWKGTYGFFAATSAAVTTEELEKLRKCDLTTSEGYTEITDFVQSGKIHNPEVLALVMHKTTNAQFHEHALRTSAMIINSIDVEKAPPELLLSWLFKLEETLVTHFDNKKLAKLIQSKGMIGQTIKKLGLNSAQLEKDLHDTQLEFLISLASLEDLAHIFLYAPTLYKKLHAYDDKRRVPASFLPESELYQASRLFFWKNQLKDTEAILFEIEWPIEQFNIIAAKPLFLKFIDDAINHNKIDLIAHAVNEQIMKTLPKETVQQLHNFFCANIPTLITQFNTFSSSWYPELDKHFQKNVSNSIIHNTNISLLTDLVEASLTELNDTTPHIMDQKLFIEIQASKKVGLFFDFLTTRKHEIPPQTFEGLFRTHYQNPEKDEAAEPYYAAFGDAFAEHLLEHAQFEELEWFIHKGYISADLSRGYRYLYGFMNGLIEDITTKEAWPFDQLIRGIRAQRTLRSNADELYIHCLRASPDYPKFLDFLIKRAYTIDADAYGTLMGGEGEDHTHIVQYDLLGRMLSTGNIALFESFLKSGYFKEFGRNAECWNDARYSPSGYAELLVKNRNKIRSATYAQLFKQDAHHVLQGSIIAYTVTSKDMQGLAWFLMNYPHILDGLDHALQEEHMPYFKQYWNELPEALQKTLNNSEKWQKYISEIEEKEKAAGEETERLQTIAENEALITEIIAKNDAECLVNNQEYPELSNPKIRQKLDSWAGQHAAKLSNSQIISLYTMIAHEQDNAPSMLMGKILLRILENTDLELCKSMLTHHREGVNLYLSENTSVRDTMHNFCIVNQSELKPLNIREIITQWHPE